MRIKRSRRCLPKSTLLMDEMASYFGSYTSEKAAALKARSFDRKAISERGLKYERLDQLTIDLLLGVR